jgi:hypothetical protein
MQDLIYNYIIAGTLEANVELINIIIKLLILNNLSKSNN